GLFCVDANDPLFSVQESTQENIKSNAIHTAPALIRQTDLPAQELTTYPHILKIFKIFFVL
ncbi:MAG: hypothetical protein OEX07_10495, partial [Gammaproteobacteria bacterium]|nr:hypothetical protein [Gammaproteobacteria bacterium]